jgi:glycosyltransferase involved in cell wall biosynthesis
MRDLSPEEIAPSGLDGDEQISSQQRQDFDADFNNVPSLQELTDLRVAVVHDWCPNFRGGERVAARICRQFPKAELFTLFDFLPEEIKQRHFADVPFHVSPASRLPFVERYYQWLFFICPFLIEQFDVTGYDAVISSSAAFARGVIARPDQPHLCYVHSPARYAWDEQFTYLRQGRLGYGPKGLAYRAMLHQLRMWDSRTAHGPDVMLANSTFVRSRIRRVYGRDATVVHPPVETRRFTLREDRDDYYVSACFAAPYKRTDLVVAAFAAMPARRLLVVGEPETRQLRALAAPNVTFLGHLPPDDYVETIGRARAMVYAGCEDFGIALVEAQACGTPLIAYGRGGALDVVRPLDRSPRPTGVLFDRQTVDDLVAAVDRFEARRSEITPYACRQNAERFSEERFDAAILRAFAVAHASACAG